ncbi:hypothetical protein BSPWISOXPB_8556 [uncultured Gammaproteobacteria bacterium]|nr:hypothetical protein BSPWISOXPB_8556 [uncultured Gammaproteobacteria bacterium]
MFDRNPSNHQPGFYVFLNTGNGFDSGKQWQSNLGGDENWKNRTTYKNGEHSKLIDLNGDGLPDRVFDHNPEADDQPGFFVYLNTGDVLTWQTMASNLGGEELEKPPNARKRRTLYID